MPSPIGHALAGIAVAWGVDLVPGAREWRLAPRSGGWDARVGGRLTWTCAALAAAPDLDLLVGAHRTVTHSLTAVAVVTLVAGVVAKRAALPPLRVALMCGAAWASHLLLDWLAVDLRMPQGIALLWPFSHTWFISGWDLFAGTERNNFMTWFAFRANARAAVQEIAILGPILWGTWLIRVKALTGLATEVAGRNHAAK